MKMLFMFPILNFILAVGSQNIDSSDVRLDNLVKLFQEENLFRELIVNETLEGFTDEDFLEGLISLVEGIYDFDDIERGSLNKQVINALRDKDGDNILDYILWNHDKKKTVRNKRFLFDLVESGKDKILGLFGERGGHRFFKKLRDHIKEKFAKFGERFGNQRDEENDSGNVDVADLVNLNIGKVLDIDKDEGEEENKELFVPEINLGNMVEGVKGIVKDVMNVLN